MSYREVTHHILCFLHTIVCERGIVGELYQTPVKINGVNFPWCWHASAEKYFNQVGSCLKSVLRAQKETKVSLSIFRPWPHATELIESWTFAVLSVNDVETKHNEGSQEQAQAIVDQISNTCAFLPSLEPDCLFKVSMLLDSQLAVPSTAEKRSSRIQELGEPLLMREMTTGEFKLRIHTCSR